MQQGNAFGNQYFDWASIPSFTEALAGGKSKVLNTLGLLLADSGKEEQPEAPMSYPLTGAVPPKQFGQGNVQMPQLGVPPVAQQPAMVAQQPSITAQPTVDQTKANFKFWGIDE